MTSEIKVGELLDHATEKKIKTLFKLYFEGCDNSGYDAHEYIPIIKFGVTDLKFTKFPDKIEMMITLERPGLLIGKAGRTIDGVAAYLTRLLDIKVDIRIRESNIWN